MNVSFQKPKYASSQTSKTPFNACARVTSAASQQTSKLSRPGSHPRVQVWLSTVETRSTSPAQLPTRDKLTPLAEVNIEVNEVGQREEAIITGSRGPEEPVVRAWARERVMKTLCLTRATWHASTGAWELRDLVSALASPTCTSQCRRLVWSNMWILPMTTLLLTLKSSKSVHCQALSLSLTL